MYGYHLTAASHGRRNAPAVVADKVGDVIRGTPSRDGYMYVNDDVDHAGQGRQRPFK